jgi:hypothetical protein
VIHSTIGVIHAYSAQIVSQRASSESCDQTSKDVSGLPLRFLATRRDNLTLGTMNTRLEPSDVGTYRDRQRPNARQMSSGSRKDARYRDPGLSLQRQAVAAHFEPCTTKFGFFRLRRGNPKASIAKV